MEKNKIYIEVDIEQKRFFGNSKGEFDYIKSEEYETIDEYAYNELCDTANQYILDREILSFKIEIKFIDNSGNEMILTTNDKKYKG